MQNLKAVFKTQSNYKNANGKSLEVVSCNGNYIDCKVPYYGFNPETGEPETDIWITGSFAVLELVSLYTEL